MSAATVGQIILVKALHQNVQLSILALLMDFLRNACLQSHQLVVTVFLYFRSNLVLHSASYSALLLRILENTGIFKALLFHKILQLLKVLLRFAGEAHDEGGANSNAGDASAQLIQQSFHLLASIKAIHAIQQSVAGVLQGDIDILAHLVQGGKGFNQFISKIIGIEVHHPNPLNAL